MPLRFAVCDDETSQSDYLISLIGRWAEASGEAVGIDAFPSAESFLFSHPDAAGYDALLLDVQMKEMDGVQLAKEIRRTNGDVPIIFVTGYDRYMAEGYDVAALHYLMKPVSYERLAPVLDRAVAGRKKAAPAVVFCCEGEQVRVRLDEICCAEAAGHSVTLRCRTGELRLNKTLAALKEELGDGFIATHRAYLVNLARVRRITKTDVILDDGSTAPLSRRLYDEVNRAFITFYKGTSP